ncbi:glycerol-3-phosphate 1-O-acyltransferase PlsY [Acholeplasma hippikon]|uniref:Glycerol-3-phosphate acyltransferase n=1 Tax=Acholeplasma hippikon TaxID=264636 RepID=A0A449BIM4_9MOLU|nr:glycerol-3-phosphate 1-O-acyltransferase PlsY [Acholeplasma hippikon]VEU82288.1 G3P acyltransferase [Acholeplasma hippikon]
MQFIYIIIALFVSYLIGSIPWGYIIPKVFRNIDIREHGSKNVGSTNVTRTLGKKFGIPVFLLDSFKGALPIIIIRYILQGQIHTDLNFINQYDIVIFYGVAAGVGHIFSIFLRGKGGKAVATGVGAVIALNPIVGLSGILIFFIVAFATRYVSIGSVVATFLVGVGMWISVALAPSQTFETQFFNLIAISFMCLLIIYMHKKNFIRLKNGTENRIGQKKNK